MEAKWHRLDCSNDCMGCCADDSEGSRNPGDAGCQVVWYSKQWDQAEGARKQDPENGTLQRDSESCGWWHEDLLNVRPNVRANLETTA